MKNIMRIFRNDLHHFRTNIVAMIVIVGISIIPSMYAWFNIAANWDPYGNTGNLQIAVASVDEGYKGTLLPMEINVGDQVISTLRGNDQIGWVFTSEKEAKEGAKSGKYYAALIITKSFSEDLLSLFSDRAVHPKIDYYVNQKENAISPKVTDTATDTVQQQIDSSFVETILDVSVNVYDEISSYLDQDTTTNFLKNTGSSIAQIGTDLSTASGTVNSFATMTGSLRGMLRTTGDILDNTEELNEKDSSLMKDASGDIRDIRKSISSVSSDINLALNQGTKAYDTLSDEITSALSSISSDSKGAADSLSGIAKRVSQMEKRYESFRNSMKEIQDSLPDDSSTTADLVGRILVRTDESIDSLKDLHKTLSNAADRIRSAGTLSDSYVTSLKKQMKKGVSGLDAVRKSYTSDLRKSLNSLSGSLEQSGTLAEGILSDVDTAIENASDLSDTADGQLIRLQKTLKKSAAMLDDASADIRDLNKRLKQASADKNISEVTGVIRSNVSVLASIWASPLKVNEEAVFPVENYGSQMTPFYTTLSYWIGAVIMVAMMSVMISDREILELQKKGPIHHYQLYFGRCMVFLYIGMIQSTIISLGDLLFLGIQCVHPFWFLVAGWVSSFIYTMLCYTLTLSFDELGKAAAVVLLVVQVAGTGGTFPIEVLPSIFHKLYLILPFTYSMDALKECIGGFYHMDYLIAVGKMLLFLIPSLLLGLIFRRPVFKLNRMLKEKLEEVKFI